MWHTEGSQIGAISWNPSQECRVENRYEVLYTPTMCNASIGATSERVNLANETSIVLPPSDVYCIKVRDKSCCSESRCAQVASLKQGV